ncbi:hypothetical protein RLOC_00000319 [Lonchura striata]|uniref:Uncharacterized protein n=1 Tax=Lonchura striata TaxID=40157 RepID=A0A218V6K1_9PASE|nr:hypothetical protein RLOC_00000319 [Lonchura striata domestica]
MLSPSNCV